MLLGGATALLPVFAKDILLTGAWGLGLLRSAPAVGALLMSLWLARFSVDRHVGRVMFTAVGVFGVATIAFGLSTSFWFSLGVLVVLGAADMISNCRGGGSGGECDLSRHRQAGAGISHHPGQSALGLRWRGFRWIATWAG